MNPAILKRIRELRALPQTALAARAGLSVDTIYRLEAGTREPSVNALEAIARALDVPAGVFVGAGWLGLVERMSARLEPGPKHKGWTAMTGALVASGHTPAAAVMTLYEQWSKETK